MQSIAADIYEFAGGWILSCINSAANNLIECTGCHHNDNEAQQPADDMFDPALHSFSSLHNQGNHNSPEIKRKTRASSQRMAPTVTG